MKNRLLEKDFISKPQQNVQEQGLKEESVLLQKSEQVMQTQGIKKQQFFFGLKSPRDYLKTPEARKRGLQGLGMLALGIVGPEIYDLSQKIGSDIINMFGPAKQAQQVYLEKKEGIRQTVSGQIRSFFNSDSKKDVGEGIENKKKEMKE